MRRLILKTLPDRQGMISLEGKDYQYLARVLRKSAGDSFRVLLPGGIDACAKIVSTGSGTLRAKVDITGAVTADSSHKADENRKKALSPVPPVVLIQAVPKGQKMDTIVRQATEAGVSLILPLIADHSISRPLGNEESKRKRERWERIIREARQQSGSDRETAVEEPRVLGKVLERWKTFAKENSPSTALVLHESPLTPEKTPSPLAQGSFHGYLDGETRGIAVAVGPEGGFSEQEVETLIDEGFLPVLLGENVLRTETASVFAVAAIQIILLERKTWILKTPE